jgi:hypothetical protein
MVERRLLLLPLAIVVVGLCCGGCIGFRIQSGLASLDWPTSIGTVTLCDVEVDRSGDRQVVHRKFKYEYVVEGKKYRSSQHSFKGIRGVNCEGDHAKDKKVAVYYNPKSPATAVLVPGVDFYAWIQLAIGLTVLLGGVALGLVMLRGRR